MHGKPAKAPREARLKEMSWTETEYAPVRGCRIKGTESDLANGFLDNSERFHNPRSYLLFRHFRAHTKALRKNRSITSKRAHKSLHTVSSSLPVTHIRSLTFHPSSPTKFPHPPSQSTNMCFYEKINFITCGHYQKRLIQHCHFARNDPGHQCFGAWSFKREWDQCDSKCDSCVRKDRQAICHNSHSLHGVASGR